MSYAPNDFKIGLFVLGSIAILIAGLFIFGASKWFTHKTFQETYISGNADGLKAGAPVLLRGVPVGQVTKINFTWNVYHVSEPRYVYVEFELDKTASLAPPGEDYREFIEQEIQKGLRARIKSQGLAAGTVVVSLEYLNPTNNPPLEFPWTPRHIYIPSAPGQMSELISGLDKAVAGLKEINFGRIGALVETDLAKGGKILTNVDRINIPEIGTNLNGLIAELRGVADQLHAFVGVTNQAPRANLAEISRRTDKLIEQLQGTVGRLDSEVAQVDLGSLNDSLENLRRASQELDEAIAKIKEYPAGAIFGKPPPPARSVERPRR